MFETAGKNSGPSLWTRKVSPPSTAGARNLTRDANSTPPCAPGSRIGRPAGRPAPCSPSTTAIPFPPCTTAGPPAYLLQQRLEGPAIYANPGRQDLTADINLTDYRAWLISLGCEETAYGTQAEFIKARAKSEADAFVLNPEGAGGAFKYVIHRRLRK